MTSSTENPKAQTWIFLFCSNLQDFRMFRGFEQFSRSIGWRVMAFSQNGQAYFLWDLTFYPIFGFWVVVLAPDMLASQTRALKTRTIA